MPSNVQIHIQEPLNNTKLSNETKITLYKLLQKYNTIISKSDNDIGQINLCKMYMATRLDAGPVAD